MSVTGSLRRRLSPVFRGNALSLLQAIVGRIDGMKFHRDADGVVTAVNLPMGEFRDFLSDLERARQLLLACRPPEA
jgi:hypothetical protein